MKHTFDNIADLIYDKLESSKRPAREQFRDMLYEALDEHPLLTSEEQQLVDYLGNSLEMYKLAFGNRHADYALFEAGVVDLQTKILVQCAARAYPDEYKGVGE
jgi:hypothetical protein